MQNSPLRVRIFDLKENDQQGLQSILLTLLSKIHELEEWKLGQLITAKTTQTAPTTEEPSVVAEHMFQLTQAYSQWDQADTKSGPVELHSVCAHVHRRMFYLNEAEDNPYRTLWAWEWCPISAEPVLKSSVKTPVPAVDQTSSTSVKQPSKESVENSVEESVKLPSKKWTVELHRNWDQTGQFGITDGVYHILLPKGETNSMAEQHAKYLTERHY